MARKPRIEYSGAVYHIMCRGDRSEDIFWSDEDRFLFLKTLGEVCEKTGWLVFSYVLMSNHYHLLLKTPEPNLVKGMKWFQGAYTQRFNARNKVLGHLFQGRYKSILVEEDPSYFQTVAAYIHLNPARAGLLDLAQNLVEYAWSSYPAYLRPSCRPDWLDCESLLSAYQKTDDSDGRAYYRRHMNKRIRELGSKAAGAVEDDDTNQDREWCIGSEAFKERMTEYLDEVVLGKKLESYAGKAKQRHGEARAGELIRQAMMLIHLPKSDLERLPKNDLRKQVIAWFIRKNTSVHAEWLSDQLHMGHRVNVSRAASKVENSRDGEVVLVKEKMLKCTD